MRVMRVKYISLNYGRMGDTVLHLVRFCDGSSKLLTSGEIVRAGLARYI